MRRHLREYPLGPRHLPGTSRRLRKRRGKCRGTRAGCANAKADAAGLAQPAQTPKQMPRDSRGLRKRQGKCRRTCAGCANVKANAAELARPAQTPKQMPQDLRGLRKRQSKCRGTRAACANAKANAAELARPAQTPKQMPREPRAGCAIKPALIQHHGALGVTAQLVDHTDIFGQGAVERERRQAVEGEKTLVEDVERAG